MDKDGGFTVESLQSMGGQPGEEQEEGTLIQRLKFPVGFWVSSIVAFKLFQMCFSFFGFRLN